MVKCELLDINDLSLSFKLPSMFIVIACMLVGISVGYMLRRFKLRFIHKLILTLIWLLLFLLGLEVGANESVIQQFGKLGYQSFLLAFAGTLGSVIFSGFLWLTVRNKSMSK